MTRILLSLCGYQLNVFTHQLILPFADTRGKRKGGDLLSEKKKY